MGDGYYVVTENPDDFGQANSCHAVVNRSSWNRENFTVGGVNVRGRQSWGAREPLWENEVIFYDTAQCTLAEIYDRIVVHHTNNSAGVQTNENRQRGRGYAALGYHFFIDRSGVVFEGRPLEVMGSHAGVGDEAGPLNDPDWGAIGIVVQGDYHHADDWFRSSMAPNPQLDTLQNLIIALNREYGTGQLLMHREVARSGHETVCPGDHMVSHVETMRRTLGLRGR